MQLLVGDTSIALEASQSSTGLVRLGGDDTPDLNRAVPALPVTLNNTQAFSSPPDTQQGYYINIAITSQPAKTTFNAWQVALFDAIWQAYRRNVTAASEGQRASTNQAIQRGWLW